MSEDKITQTVETSKQKNVDISKYWLHTFLLITIILSEWFVLPFLKTSSTSEDLNVLPNITKELAEEAFKQTMKFENPRISMTSNFVCTKLDVFFLGTSHEKARDVCIEVALRIKKENISTRTTITVLSVMIVFLFMSAMITLVDVIRILKKPCSRSTTPSNENPRKYSLAEFAKYKYSRKESSVGVIDHVAVPSRPLAGRAASLCRYESVGSAFTRMRRESVAPGAGTPIPGPGLTTGNDTPTTPPVGPARTHLKLLGGRPAPLLRRSSFPASALIDTADRRGSIDSEDDSPADGGKLKRVRIIRRH